MNADDKVTNKISVTYEVADGFGSFAESLV